MKVFRWLRRGVVIAGLGVAGSALVVTTRHLLETPQPLESVLSGDESIDREHGGELYYNVAGPEDASAIVLLHDFFPGASNFSFRHVFSQLARDYRVYAPDWLGFGMSEHPAVAYTGEFYATILNGFLRDTVQRPAVVVATGRAANIAVRAASDAPELFERLVLVAPEIFAGVLPQPSLGHVAVRAAQRVSLGIVPYAVVSLRPLLRMLAQRRSARAGEAVASDAEVEHLYACAHQFGGQHATLATMMGELDLAIPNAFALLEPPVLVVGGGQDSKHTSADLEDFVVLNPTARLSIIESAGADVFQDAPEDFVRELHGWLDAPVSRRAADVEMRVQGEPLDMGPAPEAIAPERETAGTMSYATDESAATVELIEPEMAAEPAAPAGVELVSGSAEAEVTAEPEASGYAVTEEVMPGTAADIVPGVTDSGLEGLATEAPGVAEGTSPPPEEATSVEMLPEAGEAAPESADERQARAGAEPPIAPATSITESSIEPEERQIAGEVDEEHERQAKTARGRSRSKPKESEQSTPREEEPPLHLPEEPPASAQQEMRRGTRGESAHRAPQSKRGTSKSSRSTTSRSHNHSGHSSQRRSSRRKEDK